MGKSQLGRNRASINCSVKDAFKKWLDFTKPFHKLSDMDIRLMVELLYLRWEYLGKINDESLMNEFIFSTNSRKKIMKRLDVPQDRFNNMLSLLRKKGVLKGQSITGSYIPDIGVDTTKYVIEINMNIKDE